jgi:hypothetical protein
MEIPNLSRIVETHVPALTSSRSDFLNQMRQEVLPHIRELQKKGHLRWFLFLLHPAKQLEGHDAADETTVIHLRLEPATELDVEEFIKLLPSHFLNPKLVSPLKEIQGLDGSILRDANWAHGWKIAGEASEWVLYLLEGHEGEISLRQIVQFLHFFTNQLSLGWRCLCILSESEFLEF